MNRKSLARGFVLSGTLILGSPQADGRTTPSTISFSGTFVSTQIDTNGDGQKATFQSMGTKGTGGSGTIQGVNEIVFLAQPRVQMEMPALGSRCYDS
jgi:hypothetical protein